MKRKPGKTQRLLFAEPLGDGYTMAHYQFDKCHHVEQKLYRPDQVARATRKVRCYECEKFRRLAGW